VVVVMMMMIMRMMMSMMVRIQLMVAMTMLGMTMMMRMRVCLDARHSPAVGAREAYGARPVCERTNCGEIVVMKC
jgi:hypothetical protein